MRVIRPISADEMVLEFLRGEIDSPRFGPAFKAVLRENRLTRALIDRADLANAEQNRLRRAILGTVRGYGGGAYLFRGLPSDVTWRRVSLTRPELKELLYANHETWVTLSARSRRLADGAENVDRIPTNEDANSNIREVAKAIASGRTYPALITVSDGSARIVIAEGHTRATAYLYESTHLPAELEIILGTSETMKSWVYW